MKKETRFGHSEGITDITFAPDGSKIITCGTDGDVRIWEGFSDDDPISFSASDSCFGVVVTAANQVIVGTENNAVEAYEFPKGKFIDNKLKFTGAVNHLDVSRDGKYLLAGSADMTLQLTSVGDSTSPPVKVDAHTAPVLSVAIDPMKEFISSSGCDGSVCVWSFENPKKLVKKWTQVFPSSNDITTSPTLCRMAWYPLMGKQLAVPEKEKVVIYRRDNWVELKALKCSKLTKLFSIVCFSGCGGYIAAGGSDGTIAIWDAFTYEIHTQIKEANHITGITFNPNNDQVLCTDTNGRLLCIQEFTRSSSKDDNDEAKVKGDEETPKTNGLTTESSSDQIDTNFSDDFPVDDLFDDDDGENAFSISKIKADVGFVGDEYVGPRKAKSALVNGVTSVDDNDDALSVSSLASSKVSRPVPAPAPAFNPFTPQQKSFQPSSTPESLEHRFMTWNNVGIIRSYSTEDEEFNEDAIDVEFHDESVHMPIHLQNNSDYCVGNLSAKVVVLGSHKTADERSKIFCLTFDIWDTSKEWTIDLPKGEDIIGFALGSGWIAASTSERRIRLFSITGIQKFVYDFGGDLIAISAYENLLFVTYHNGVGINGDQNIAYCILKISFNSSKLTPLIMDACLPLSRASQLSWVGFTDEGTPAFSDSKEILRILNGRMWSPFCDMRAHLSGPKDHFWVVGVSELALHVRAVKCKGAKYPMTVPKPIIMMLEAKLPLCEMDKEKSKLEDLMLQSLLLSSISKKKERNGFDMEEYKDKADMSMKEHLMKLFTLSCEANRDFRAFEYVTMMPSSHAIQIATKYSSRLNRRVLTDHLHAVGRKKMEEENQEVEEEIDDFESNITVTHVDHRYTSSASDVPPSSEAPVSRNSSFSSHHNLNGNASNPIIIDDNPLLKRQKEEIRSILSPMGFRKNPFKKDKDKVVASGSGTPATEGIGLNRHSSFTSSLAKNNSLTEDSESQNGGFDSSLNEESSSKGVSKIDVWKKPVEKQSSLPEFNPKNPNRKSRNANKAGASNSNAAGSTAATTAGGTGRKNPFEKKANKDSGDTSGGKKQRTLFEMRGRKSLTNVNGNGSTDKATNGSSNSNPNSPFDHNSPSGMEDGDSENYDSNNFDDEITEVEEIMDKKRKRQKDSIDIDDSNDEEGKRSKFIDEDF